MAESVGEELRRLRAATGLGRERVAAAAGVSYKTVERAEAGLAVKKTTVSALRDFYAGRQGARSQDSDVPRATRQRTQRRHGYDDGAALSIWPFMYKIARLDGSEDADLAFAADQIDEFLKSTKLAPQLPRWLTGTLTGQIEERIAERRERHNKPGRMPLDAPTPLQSEEAAHADQSAAKGQ